MKNFFKTYYLNIIAALVFFAGVAIVAYPTVSSYWNSKAQSRAISEYRNVVSRTSEYDIKRSKLAAYYYNQALYESQQKNMPLAEGTSDYMDILNPNGDGIMGYLVIPIIDVNMPIYHGTEEKVLRRGAGHLPESSVPIGGESTHALIFGHRGVTSADLFDDLDQLEKGDHFEIHVLNEVLYYEVYDIAIVEPRELGSLRIVGEEDLVTLVTCTPYGSNTHRLLVKARRIDESDIDLLISSEARRISRGRVAFAVGIFVWTAVMVVLIGVSFAGNKRRLSRDEAFRRKKILEKYLS